MQSFASSLDCIAQPTPQVLFDLVSRRKKDPIVVFPLSCKAVVWNRPGMLILDARGDELFFIGGETEEQAKAFIERFIKSWLAIRGRNGIDP